MPRKSPSDSLPAKPGVYLLTHKVTRDTYIGSSKNIRTRIVGHRASFEAGSCNDLMRRLVHMHGEEFDASVLELVEEQRARLQAETRWIEKLKPSLNVEKYCKCTRSGSSDGKPTRQVNFRLRQSTVARLKLVLKAHPTLWTINGAVEAALAEWMPTAERMTREWSSM